LMRVSDQRACKHHTRTCTHVHTEAKPNLKVIALLHLQIDMPQLVKLFQTF